MAEEDNTNVVSEEDEVVMQQEAALEEGVNAELEEKLPFPTARVVRLIKKNLKKEHQVRSEVKIAANVLLGEIIEDIAKQMDEEEYFTISIDHFNKASKKYREVNLQLKRMENIKKMLEKQRAELEEKIMQIENAEEWR